MSEPEKYDGPERRAPTGLPGWLQAVLGAIVAGVMTSGALTLGDVVADDRAQAAKLAEHDESIKTLRGDVAQLKTDSAVAVEILRRIEAALPAK